MEAPAPNLSYYFNPTDCDLNTFVVGLFNVYKLHSEPPYLSSFPSSRDMEEGSDEFEIMQHHLFDFIGGLDTQFGTGTRLFMRRKNYNNDGTFTPSAHPERVAEEEGGTFRELTRFCEETIPINMFSLVKLMMGSLRHADAVYSFIRVIASAGLCRETSLLPIGELLYRYEKDFVNALQVFAFLGGDAPLLPGECHPDLFRGSFAVEATDDSRFAWRLVLTALGIVKSTPLAVYLSHTRDLQASKRSRHI